MTLIYLPSDGGLGWGGFWLYVLCLLAVFGMTMWQKVKRMKADERGRIRSYRHRKG
jgi:hypothetical protein